jgi:multidrug efflux pump subunit AcrA (membrane-fusion protein)
MGKYEVEIIMSISAIFVGLLCMVTAQSSEAMPGSVTIKDCLVVLEEEVEVPAEEAGVLLTLPVKEGQSVKAGEVLAQIDDILPRMEVRVAENKLKVAKKQADSDINVKYTRAAAEYKKVNCTRDEESNKKAPGSVPQATVDEHLLDYKAAYLSVDKSIMEQAIAVLQVNVSMAELDAAKEKVDRRQIKSPLDGQIRKIYRHVGEWLQQAEPVLHVVRMNLLHVDGFLKASQFSPEEINGRPVTVKVVFARGRTETFGGKIIFVDPLVQAGGEYLVRAEVQNRQENGQWLLRAGMNAEMTIQLK